MTTQGGQANKTGNVLEQLVVGTLRTHGFAEILYSEYKKRPETFGNEILLRNAPYTTLYHGRGFTEFLLISERYALRARIECKWQQKPGSVDEKLPYLYLSCIDAMPEDEVIILIDGPGFREGAVQWLKDAASSRKYVPNDRPRKMVRVFNATEFLTWCNSTFK